MAKIYNHRQPCRIDTKQDWTKLSSYTNPLTLLVLKGDDGDTGHAVCVANGWIIDSTLKKALPLSRDSFDLCLGENCKFVAVERGYMFVRHKKKRIRKQIDPNPTKKKKNKK
jgi:hypothetical protein